MILPSQGLLSAMAKVNQQAGCWLVAGLLAFWVNSFYDLGGWFTL